jgi:hypothetical protein
MAGPAGHGLPPVDHLDPLVLFFGYEDDGVAFGAIESHGFHMGIMAEGDFPHPLDRILDVAPPDSRQGEAGEGQDPAQEEPKKKSFHRSTSLKKFFELPEKQPNSGGKASSDPGSPRPLPWIEKKGPLWKNQMDFSPFNQSLMARKWRKN